MSTVRVLFHLHTSAVALGRIGAWNTSAAAKEKNNYLHMIVQFYISCGSIVNAACSFERAFIGMETSRLGQLR